MCFFFWYSIGHQYWANFLMHIPYWEHLCAAHHCSDQFCIEIISQDPLRWFAQIPVAHFV